MFERIGRLIGIAFTILVTVGVVLTASSAQAVIPVTSVSSQVSTAITPMGDCKVTYDFMSNLKKDIYSFSGDAVRVSANQSYYWEVEYIGSVPIGRDSVIYHGVSLPALRNKHRVTSIKGSITDGNTGYRIDCKPWKMFSFPIQG